MENKRGDVEGVARKMEASVLMSRLAKSRFKMCRDGTDLKGAFQAYMKNPRHSRGRAIDIFVYREREIIWDGQIRWFGRLSCLDGAVLTLRNSRPW
jgi:hypothetical protein